MFSLFSFISLYISSYRWDKCARGFIEPGRDAQGASAQGLAPRFQKTAGALASPICNIEDIAKQWSKRTMVSDQL